MIEAERGLKSARDREPTVYWDRALGRRVTEKVYGNQWVQWLYGNPLGRLVADQVLSAQWMSRLAGTYQSSKLSRSKIAPFIQDFQINMDEYEPGPFMSFNHFFIRKFKPGLRTFVQEPRLLPAFAEARYLAFEQVDPHQSFPVKGEHLSAETVLGDLTTARQFKGGSVLIARLCPTDYHRFHFPDEGTLVSEKRVHGKFHSVNPLALSAKSEILASNERHVSIIDTKNFGKIAYVEVGAMCVGRIIHTHSWSRPFKRGEEKGFFLFGASTVILFGEPNRWKPDLDLVENTQRRLETFVRLGDRVAYVP